MTGLLVSVRSADEADLALSAGVDVIDVKEPQAGALGAASADVLAAVVQRVAGRCLVSAALGELADACCDRPPLLPAGLRFAKFGLSQCGHDRRWVEQLRQLWNFGNWQASPVAVAYADHQLCQAPDAAAVLAAAVELRCAAVLVDTFDKTAGRLMDHWTVEQVARFVHLAQEQAMPVVLAGSLQPDDIRQLAHLKPYLFAVRGAACLGGRQGPLDIGQIGRLRQAIHAA